MPYKTAEKKKEQAKAYYERNKEKMKQYYLDNKERIVAVQKEYYNRIHKKEPTKEEERELNIKLN